LTNPNPPLTPSESRVLWLQVSGLAIVVGAIALTWLIYRLYLPQLFQEFGFNKSETDSAVKQLLVVEGFWAAILGPIAGYLFQAQPRLGTKLLTRFTGIPGILLSSVLFMAISLVFLFSPRNFPHWLLWFVVLAWFSVVTMFHGPMVSLLSGYTQLASLPLATSLLTLITGAIDSLKPFANVLILQTIGPVYAFLFGSFVLLAAAVVLRFIYPVQLPSLSSNNPEPVANIRRQSLLLSGCLIFVTGVSVTWGQRFLTGTLTKLVENSGWDIQINGLATTDWARSALAIALMLASLPAGVIATRLGNRRVMLLAIGVIIIFLLLMGLSPSLPLIIGLIFLSGATLSLIKNGTIPFALVLMPPHRSGLAMALYFGGASFATTGGQFGMSFNPLPNIPLHFQLLWGAIAFLVTGLCIVASTVQSQS